MLSASSVAGCCCNALHSAETEKVTLRISGSNTARQSLSPQKRERETVRLELDARLSVRAYGPKNVQGLMDTRRPENEGLERRPQDRDDDICNGRPVASRTAYPFNPWQRPKQRSKLGEFPYVSVVYMRSQTGAMRI